MSKDINVLIDGYLITKQRGLGRYVKELLFSLAKYNRDDFIINVVVPKSITKKDYIYPERINYIQLPSCPYPIWEQVMMPLYVNKTKPDIFHSPYNTKPLIFNLMNQFHIVTIHDLMFMDSKHKVSGIYQQIGNYYRKWVVSKLCRNNNQRIVTVSKQSQKEIIDVLGIDSTVVYTPVEFTVSKLKKVTETIKEVNYFFHVGGTSPHKNTKMCIDAFLASNLDNYKLVISGMDKNCELARHYQSEKVIFTGWISDEQIASYYQNSIALIFPSLREGYGLPIIEAFSFNVPVITSNIDPMREISSDAALLVNPNSLDDISNALKNIAFNKELRNNLKEMGVRRLKEISSKNMADSIYKIYLGATQSEKGNFY